MWLIRPHSLLTQSGVEVQKKGQIQALLSDAQGWNVRQWEQSEVQGALSIFHYEVAEHCYKRLQTPSWDMSKYCLDTVLGKAALIVPA